MWLPGEGLHKTLLIERCCHSTAPTLLPFALRNLSYFRHPLNCCVDTRRIFTGLRGKAPWTPCQKRTACSSHLAKWELAPSKLGAKNKYFIKIWDVFSLIGATLSTSVLYTRKCTLPHLGLAFSHAHSSHSGSSRPAPFRRYFSINWLLTKTLPDITKSVRHNHDFFFFIKEQQKKTSILWNNVWYYLYLTKYCI